MTLQTAQVFANQCSSLLCCHLQEAARGNAAGLRKKNFGLGKASVYTAVDRADALCIAATNEHTDCVKVLLEKGVSPSDLGSRYQSPLYHAAEKGNWKLAAGRSWLLLG